MLEDMPRTVRVEVAQGVEEMSDGSYRYVGKSPGPTLTHEVVLERDGEPMMLSDAPIRWVSGERDGWRAWPTTRPASDRS